MRGGQCSAAVRSIRVPQPSCSNCSAIRQRQRGKSGVRGISAAVGSSSTDVVVVGGGVLGMSAGTALAALCHSD